MSVEADNTPIGEISLPPALLEGHVSEPLDPTAIREYFNTMFIEHPPQSWALREATVTAIQRVATFHPDGMVLDLGCGIGKCSLAAAENFFVHAIDLSDVALGILQAQAAERNLSDKIRVHDGDIRNPDFLIPILEEAQQQGGFSMVIAYGLLEYFTPDETSQLLQALMQATKPGGVHYVVHLARPQVKTPISPFEINMKNPHFVPLHYILDGWTTVCAQISYRYDEHPIETGLESVRHVHCVERQMVVKASMIPEEFIGITMT